MASGKHRVVIVTGASRGVGKGVALGLAGEGTILYVTARPDHQRPTGLPGSLEQTVAEIANRGGEGIAVPCDHRDDAQIEALFRKIEQEQGRLDILVNNVFAVPGDLQQHKPFWQRPLSHWNDMIDLGLRAHYVASRLAAPIMVAQRHGLIVNISSPGARCYMHSVIYGMGKAATDKMAHDMARELRAYQVAAVSLWPGIVLTERVMPAVESGQLPPEYAALKDGFESQEYAGRIIDALFQAPDLHQRSGRSWYTAELGQIYDVQDRDGNIPASYRHILGGPAEPSEAEIM